MLNSVVENGTAKRAMLPGIKVGGKTGTTNSYRDAWFIGFTGQLRRPASGTAMTTTGRSTR